jgi:putative DNA primase/helicase
MGQHTYVDGSWYSFARTHWSKRSKAPLQDIDNLVFLRGAKPRERSTSRLESIARYASTRTADIKLDQDPYLLNCLNGTLDLRTGKLRRHESKDYITRVVPVAYDPNATSEEWEAMLRTWSCADASWVTWLQWLMGQGLIGEVRTELIPVFTGCGGNGKSTLLTAVSQVLGPYAGTVSGRAVAVRRGGDTHTSAWGRQVGKRLVVATELDQTAALDLPALKGFCGYSPIAAQLGMGKDFVDLVPTWRMVCDMNGTPRITAGGNAERRRLRVVPWDYTYKGPMVASFARKFAEENAQAILTWLVRGAMMDVAREPVCTRISQATEDCFDANDPVKEWISESCARGMDARAERGELYKSYTAWCMATNTVALAKQTFYAALQERGYRTVKNGNGARMFCGLRLAGPARPGVAAFPAMS